VLALSLQLCGAGAPALLIRHTAHCLGWLLEGQAASVDALLQAAGPGQARLLGPEDPSKCAQTCHSEDL
ncbi:hypothetical protein HaLaN_25078, partial [Haematococcus lacustris]